jgi:plasmid stability protein
VHVLNVDRMSKMIQIRDVPDKVHAVLRARAAREGMSLSEFLLAELRAVAERPSLDELLGRIAHREAIELRESPARAVRAERDAR